MRYKIGELVKWLEDYDDGDIVKDAGIGIVLGTRNYTYSTSSYTLYTVYRNKHADTIQVSDRSISKLKSKRRKNEFI
jgi:hypothetical protein